MSTIFMNFRNSGKSDPHRLLPNLRDKKNLKRCDAYVALPNLSIYYTVKSLVPNKSFDQLLDISSKRFTFFKTFDLELSIY